MKHLSKIKLKHSCERGGRIFDENDGGFYSPLVLNIAKKEGIGFHELAIN